jgi:enamine deaminase RidA (YjgF/YER057c/UK114 family)
MSDRINYSSGAPWENVVGYSRAVKTGNHIEVSGTVAADKNGNVIGKGDPFVQTDYIFSRIE